MRESYEYLHERLTHDEHCLCVTAFVHALGPRERKVRAKIMHRQMKIDLRWGFFERGVWALVRRLVYRLFVHSRLRKRHLH